MSLSELKAYQEGCHVFLAALQAPTPLAFPDFSEDEEAYRKVMEEEVMYRSMFEKFTDGTLAPGDIDACLANFKDPATDQVVLLNKEQKSVLYTAFCGRKRRNIFYTGSGGVGKTVVTNAIIHFLKCIYDPTEFGKKVAVTASTGIAATHISGCTLSSMAGIGVPLYDKDFDKLWTNANKRRWRELEILIIDEISMLSGEFLVIMIAYIHTTSLLQPLSFLSSLQFIPSLLCLLFVPGLPFSSGGIGSVEGYWS